MRKNYFLLFFAIVFFAGKAAAQLLQPCSSDEMRKRLIALHPDILQIEADYENQINNAMKKIDLNKVAKTTFTDQSGNQSFWYDIPIVIHIVHDYGTEYLTDDNIFNDLIQWNYVYSKQNADTADVIPPFRKWIGNPHIRLHLASRDPSGNPTKGITRHRSYLTYIGGEESKVDDWPPTSYINIWFINQMNGANQGAAAYAHLPPDVTYIPYWDGVISLASYHNVEWVINHECGHVLNLLHPWGSTNNPAVACGDDNVDDTPPTKGHAEPGCQYALPSNNPNSTYDSACASNYFKLYTNAAGGDSLVNYPDTSNAQNIMDYTYCAKMFTIGQVQRMHYALNNTVASRNNLWDSANLVYTGVYDVNHNLIGRLDLKPIPDFSATKGGSSYIDRMGYFAFPGTPVNFTNESWNDTITNLTWTFSNGASVPTSTSLTSVQNTFADPGWVTLTMTATGNHTGDSSVTWSHSVFVADSVGTSGQDVFQEFTPTGDAAKWPFFNYYNNEFKWQIANTGMYDNYSLEYTGFDNRINTLTGTYPVTGTPTGDADDFFTIPVDLRTYSVGHCSLNFDYSGASRSSNSIDITDTLQIDFTVNKGATWTRLAILSKGSLDNKGAVSTAYTPTSPSDWAHQSIDIPAAAISNGAVVFRFRYRPGTGPADGGGNTYSSGNNFFMDRIHFTSFPSSVGNVNLNNTDVAVVPNPTSGDAYVILKDADNTVAKIVVTDITGKVVYTTSLQVNGNAAQILIPHAAIAVAGMYIIQATTGAKTYTQKLVVY